jgi:BatD DUF11 like domain
MRLSLRTIYRPLFIAAFFLLMSASGFAQGPVIKTSVDKNNILIGEQLQLKVEASFEPDLYQVNWLSVPDTMPHFEVIARGKIDSSFTSDNKLTGLSQIITLTSFDSGQWRIPSFPINFDPLIDDTTLYLHTDTVSIGVYFLTSDTTNTLKDIKPIRLVPPASRFWYWVVGGVLILLLIAILIWIIRVNRKNKKVPYKTVASAYSDAMNALEKLNEYDLTDAQQLKIYHSKLAEIFKLFFSYKQNVNRLSRTTDEVLIHLKEERLSNETFARLAAALRCGDAVKFAKYFPSPAISKECLTDIKTAIESLNK